MKTKSLLVDIKEAPSDAGEGTFTGYASVFGNKDSYGDVVIPGAFTESLKSYGENGSNIPCYWSHQMSDPKMCIGWTKSAVEDDHGLRVEVELDLENPNGAQAYKLMKKGVVNQMSFAFEVEDFADAKSDELGYHTELRKLKIFEVSVVQVGANQATELLDVKAQLSDFETTGSLPSKVSEKLIKAQELLESAVNDFSGSQPEEPRDEGSDEEQLDANGEDRESDKPEELTEAKSDAQMADEVEALLTYCNLKGI